MGTIDIVKKQSDDFQLYHNTYFFNVEITFLDEGRYALGIFLVDETTNFDFFEDEGEGNIEDETEASPIAATILEVR